MLRRDGGNRVTSKLSGMLGTSSERLNAAIKLPSGARFFVAALQVNPICLSEHTQQENFFQDRIRLQPLPSLQSVRRPALRLSA